MKRDLGLNLIARGAFYGILKNRVVPNNIPTPNPEPEIEDTLETDDEITLTMDDFDGGEGLGDVLQSDVN